MRRTRFERSIDVETIEQTQAPRESGRRIVMSKDGCSILIGETSDEAFSAQVCQAVLESAGADGTLRPWSGLTQRESDFIATSISVVADAGSLQTIAQAGLSED